MVLFLILLPIITALVVALGCWLGWTGYAIALATVFAVAVVWALASNIRTWWPHVGRHYRTFNVWVRNHGREILAFFSFLITLGILVYAFNNCVWPKLRAEAAKNTGSCCNIVGSNTAPAAQPTASAPSTVITDLRAGQPSQWVRLDPATCVVSYQTVTETGDTTVINTGRDTTFVADGDKVQLGVVDSLQFWFKNRSGRLILTKAPKHGYTECRK